MKEEFLAQDKNCFALILKTYSETMNLNKMHTQLCSLDIKQRDSTSNITDDVLDKEHC